MKKQKAPRIEDTIVDVIVDILSKNYGQEYTFEGFIQETIEIYAFSKSDEREKYCILRIGVSNLHHQIYISNILTPPLLVHKGVGKKLTRIVFEIGQLYNYDVFVVQLTDGFKKRLLRRGALPTNEPDILQIVETTNLLEPENDMDFTQEFECVDRYGNANRFKYSREERDEGDFEKIIYRVVPADLPTTDWFEFSVVKIDETTAKVSIMNNNSVPELSGKGIAEKLIELGASELGLTIISSSNKSSSQKLETEWRSNDASGVWDRLVHQKKAVYDEELDIYTYCP